MCDVCALPIYTISISIFFVAQEGLCLIESNQQIYDFYKWVIHCIKKLLIRCNTGSCCAHIGDVNAACPVFVYLCLWYQIRVIAKTMSSVSSLQLIRYLLRKTLSKVVIVQRRNKFRSIIPLSKITYKLWCDNTFSQRNKAIKKAGSGLGQNWKKEDQQYRRGLHKLGRSEILCRLWEPCMSGIASLACWRAKCGEKANVKYFYQLIHTVYMLFFLDLIPVPRNSL